MFRGEWKSKQKKIDTVKARRRGAIGPRPRLNVPNPNSCSNNAQRFIVKQLDLPMEESTVSKSGKTSGGLVRMARPLRGWWRLAKYQYPVDAFASITAGWWLLFKEYRRVVKFLNGCQSDNIYIISHELRCHQRWRDPNETAVLRFVPSCHLPVMIPRQILIPSSSFTILSTPSRNADPHPAQQMFPR
ncbi:hypothetical protein FIBSPDRAFT_479500 [Athelia psychrophila]|uniref:Uncharacterized protein n=1 Tax=Athelia psychrophila TaxID=1759441 RepID=A0A166VD05_9AGAM|nr:hypothetical protein FIBSPDRAFT_479500 [Fibularhizoctonia sp. CBS 109695]